MRPRGYTATLAVAIIVLALTPASVAAEGGGGKECGPGEAGGKIPTPPAGSATVVEGHLNDNCKFVVDRTRTTGMSEAPGPSDTSLGTEGDVSATSGVTAAAIVQSHRSVTTRMWDCCGILLTEARLDLWWNWDGRIVTARWVQLAESHHRELTGGGWWVSAWWLGKTAGCVGCASIAYEGVVDFSYQGIFDSSGTRYKNQHINRLTGKGTGGWACSWQISWRNSFAGWHTQAWCA